MAKCECPVVKGFKLHRRGCPRDGTVDLVKLVPKNIPKRRKHE